MGVHVCVRESERERERDERNEIRKWRRVEKFFELQKGGPETFLFSFDIETFF